MARELTLDMNSGPIVAMVWQGKDVVKTGRTMLGATNPLASAPGTIRGDYAIVHLLLLIRLTGAGCWSQCLPWQRLCRECQKGNCLVVQGR